MKAKRAKSQLLFIGVSTAGSAIMKIFPVWAEMLELNTEIRGCDLPLRAPRAAYRRALREILDTPLIAGALVTAHKIDLLRAGRDMFAELDAHAALCDEVSCIVKRAGRLLGYAVDPLSSALALADFVPCGHWAAAPRDVLCLGAGGAATAISVCMAGASQAGAHPRRFILTDILPERLAAIRRAHQRLAAPLEFEYHLSADGDARLADLPPGSLVINATGLGKDRPGSPLSAAAVFPRDGLIWELNYRGQRDFMRAALAQAAPRRLTVEDGWRYFLHGWTQVIAEVFDIDIPTSGPGFDAIAAIAANATGRS